MQNTTDGKMHLPTLTPLSKRRDFIESRLIIYRYLSQMSTFKPAMILHYLDVLLGRLGDVMDYSVNVQSPINEEKTTKELIFISLLSQATSLPVEAMEPIIFLRLYNTKVAGIRGASWIASTLLNTPAPTPSLPRAPTASRGPAVWRTTSFPAWQK